jgi:acyl dehydratase
MALVEMNSPRLGPLYLAAAFGALRRNRPASVPDDELVQPEVVIDVDALAAYNRVCGFRLTDTVPVTFPHVLAFPLTLGLMTRADFPVPLLGLVHIANRIETLGPLRITDRPTLRVRASGPTAHPRGRQFAVVTEAHLDGACVWREHSTYLRRAGKPAPRQAVPPASPEPTTRLVLPAAVGRRYAAVAGDRNPIHTSRLAARLFGFRRPIAHGMYMAARCLAALEGRLPDAGTAEVEFHRPLPLPGTAGFTATPTGADWSLTLTDLTTGRPHLTGTVRVSRAAGTEAGPG